MASAQYETLVGRNDVLQVNPTTSVIDITTPASSFLWAEFCFMVVAALGISIWTFLKVNRGERTFHYLSIAILATASVAYFSLAADLGSTPIEVEFIRNFTPKYVNGELATRSIWYARYIDWTITTPLLLLEILLVSGLPLSTIFITIFFDILMIVTGLIGALVASTYKWGYYVLGCAAMLYVFWILYVPGRQSARALGDEFSKAYLISTGLLSFLWFIYPICWALADGGNVISPTGEMVFYGILDFLAKPVFALVHLYSVSSCDYTRLQLDSSKFSEFAQPSQAAGPGAVEAGHAEKRAEHEQHATANPQVAVPPAQ